MAVFVAFLRAVNVGGTGKLPMARLRELCEAAGFEDVATYIQSGNVVLRSKRSAAETKRALEVALAKHMGKPVGVHLRTPRQLEAVLARNPFEAAPPNRVLVHLLDRPASGKTLAGLDASAGEQVEPSGREVFVHYPDGMGRSKLKLPFAGVATSRNLNTVRKMLELARGTSS